MAARVVQHDYIPRPQFIPLHNRTVRWAVIVAHRRMGKTVACINELVIRALRTKKKNARFAYIAPFYSQAKNVAWTYLKEATDGMRSRPPRESDLRIELPNGAWITLYGSDNPDTLRGLYFDGVILDEYGDSRPSLWEQVVRPTLADRKGWAIFIGTPKGKNHFYDIYELAQNDDDWLCLTLKVSETGVLDEEEQRQMKLTMSDESWDQEMECNFNAAILGTYYASIIKDMEAKGDKHFKRRLYDPHHGVYAAFDIGRTDNTAIWFWQEDKDHIRIIDYYQSNGQDIAHYIDKLIEKPYRYETLYLPHDSAAKTFATQRSAIEQFQQPSIIDKAYADVKFRCERVPRLDVQDGIQAVRLVMPHCVFDIDNTKYGLECLRAYKRKFNEMTKQFMQKPDHDWASDGADAFRYLALVASRDSKIKFKPYKPQTSEDVNTYGMITNDIQLNVPLNDLFEDRERDEKARSRVIRI